MMIDYTTTVKRVGSNTPDGKLIAKCPKCGKKGALKRSEYFDERDGKVWNGEVIHYRTSDNVLHSKEYCGLSLSAQGEALRCVRHVFDFLVEAVRLSVIEDVKALIPEYSELSHEPDKYRGGRRRYTSRINLPVCVVLELLVTRRDAL